MINIKKRGDPIAKIKKNNKIIYLDRSLGLNNNNKKNKCICQFCKKQFTQEWNLKRHLKVCKVKEFLKNNENSGGGEIGTDLKLTESSLIPLPQNFREILYIAGCQGSGKSYYANMYLEQFKKKFEDKEIILFSAIGKDKVFKDKGYKRILLNDDLLENPINPKEELSNTCCVFDDIETMNKDIKKCIVNIRKYILVNGRDQEDLGNDIYCVCTNHKVTNWSETSDMIYEATSVTIFPRSGNVKGIKRILGEYLGLSPKQVKQILDVPSRWATVYKTFPQYCLHEKGIFLLT